MDSCLFHFINEARDHYPSSSALGSHNMFVSSPKCWLVFVWLKRWFGMQENQSNMLWWTQYQIPRATIQCRKVFLWETTFPSINDPFYVLNLKIRLKNPLPLAASRWMLLGKPGSGVLFWEQILIHPLTEGVRFAWSSSCSTCLYTALKWEDLNLKILIINIHLFIEIIRVPFSNGTSSCSAFW